MIIISHNGIFCNKLKQGQTTEDDDEVESTGVWCGVIPGPPDMVSFSLQ